MKTTLIIAALLMTSTANAQLGSDSSEVNANGGAHTGLTSDSIEMHCQIRALAAAKGLALAVKPDQIPEMVNITQVSSEVNGGSTYSIVFSESNPSGRFNRAYEVKLSGAHCVPESVTRKDKSY